MERKKTQPSEFINDLTNGNVAKQLIVFAAPLFLSNLLQALYNIVDMVIVGRFVGANALSSVSIGGDVLSFITFIAIGFSGAGQIIVAQYIGAGMREKLNHLIGTILSFGSICALILSGICFLLRGHILFWMNTPTDAWSYTMTYIMTCAAGLVFIYGYNMISAILRGMGDSKHPLMFVGIASGLNVALDVLFVVVFRWAVFGVALATILAQAGSFIWSLVYLYHRKEGFCFDFKAESFIIRKDVFIPLLKLGIPMTLTFSLLHFSRLIVNSWIYSYGVIAAAVTGIGTKLQIVMNTLSNSMSVSGGTMIGQCIGAEKYNRVYRIIGLSALVSVSLAVILTAITVLFPNAVFGMFSSDPDVLKLALTYVPVAVTLYFGSALRGTMNSLVSGSGNSRLNLIVGLLDGIVARIGLALILGNLCGMGLLGYWYAHSLAGYVPFFIGLAYLFTGLWRTRKHVILSSTAEKT